MSGKEDRGESSKADIGLKSRRPFYCLESLEALGIIIEDTSSMSGQSSPSPSTSSSMSGQSSPSHSTSSPMPGQSSPSSSTSSPMSGWNMASTSMSSSMSGWCNKGKKSQVNKGKKSQVNKGKKSQAATKAHHNELERGRRMNIKNGFHELSMAVPNLKKKKKPSRLQILKKAISFLQRCPDIDMLIKEIASMEKENGLLKRKFDEYEHAIKTNDVEAIKRLDSEELPLQDRRNLLGDEETDSEDYESPDEDGSKPTTSAFKSKKPRMI